MTSRPWLPVVAIAALGHAAAFLVLRPDRQPHLWEYGVIAGNLLDGHGFSLPRPGGPSPTAMQEPFYPLLLAGFLRFAPAPFVTLLAFQSAVWIAAAGLFARLSARCLGTRTAPVWLALALWPPHVVYAQKYAPLVFRSTALALVLLAGLLLAERPTARRALALGGALGAAALVRATYQALPLVLLAMAWAGPRPRRPRLVALAAAIAVGALVLLPWPLRNLGAVGAFVPATTSAGYSLMLGNHPEVSGALTPEADRRVPREFQWRDEVAVDRELRARVLAAWRDDPAGALGRYARKLGWLWTWYPGVGWRYPAAWALPYQVLWSCTLALAVAGLSRARRAGAPHPYLLLGTSAFLLAIYALFFANLRLRFEVEPLLVAYAACALSRGGPGRDTMGACAPASG